MGSKYKDRYRNERSRSREINKNERFGSPSVDFKRFRFRSESPSVEALKNLARMPASEMNYQRPIEFDQDFFFRMSKRLREDFTDSVDRGK